MPTTEQVLASHEAALVKQNAEKVSIHYDKDAVVVVNGETYPGQKEIALMYARLINDPLDATWLTDVAVIHEDLAYVEWASEAGTSKIKLGIGTFIVTNGFINRQTASFSIVLNE